jgi:nucleotide-binding universal stress UspA family protein
VVHRSSEPTQPGNRIVVGVDGTELSLPAIEFAYRMASFRESALTVLHCYWTATPVAPSIGGDLLADLEVNRALVSESLAGMSEKFPDVEVAVHLVSGFADRKLIAASPDYDLVVIGHHRLSPFNDLVYRSVAPAILEHADGAVAVVPVPHAQLNAPDRRLRCRPSGRHRSSGPSATLAASRVWCELLA